MDVYRVTVIGAVEDEIVIDSGELIPQALARLHIRGRQFGSGGSLYDPSHGAVGRETQAEGMTFHRPGAEE